MFKDEYVFSQLVKFLDYEKFKYIVKKYNGNKLLKTVDIRSPKTVISVHFSSSKPMAMQIY